MIAQLAGAIHRQDGAFEPDEEATRKEARNEVKKMKEGRLKELKQEDLTRLLELAYCILAIYLPTFS